MCYVSKKYTNIQKHDHNKKMAHAKQNIVLIISGSIAAYKALDLIRQLTTPHCSVTCVLTPSARQFITPLSIAVLSNNTVYEDMFSLTDETEMGHIQLSRMADIVVAAPASANLVAKMACGLADNLATTILLTTTAPIIMAPAMNVTMWNNKATQRNLHQIVTDGHTIIYPEKGTLACGEEGVGKMAGIETIAAVIKKMIPAECKNDTGNEKPV